MVAKVIDGKLVSASIRQECRERVDALRKKTGVTPGLAVVLVGDNPASAIYVSNKVARVRRSRHPVLEEGAAGHHRYRLAGRRDSMR